MVDITHKANTLRMAIAQAIVKVSDVKTIEAIQQNKVPKGNVFEMSRAAGLLGIKKTPEILPDCHPLPIEYAHIAYETEGLDIQIRVTVKTIYKTGVEVEAMHGASIVALNLYDMLKPIDKGVEIHHIKLLEKHGGKSDYQASLSEEIQAAIIVCSDTVSKGEKQDKAGLVVKDLLGQWNVSTVTYEVIPDDIEQVQSKAKEAVSKGVSLIIFIGGTGLSPRDTTPEALQPLLDRPIPGIEEVMRSYGQQRTSFSMLSRSVAGMMDNSLVLAIPGSTKGAQECIQAIFPSVLHIFEINKGQQHD